MNLHLDDGKYEITIESLKSTHFIPPTDLFKLTNRISEFCKILAKNYPELFDIEEIIRSGDKNQLQSFKRFAEQNAWKAGLSDNKIESIKQQSERLSKYIDATDITFNTPPAQDALIAIALDTKPDLNSNTNAEIQSIKELIDQIILLVFKTDRILILS